MHSVAILVKIRKGDIIRIIAGKDKGKSGKILKVFPQKGKILIEGLNLYKKHVRPKRRGEKGEVVLVPRPLDVSNAMLICVTCHQATRIGYRLEGKNKVRFCRRCEAAN